MKVFEQIKQKIGCSTTGKPTPQRYRVGSYEVQELELLSEGGYGFIWKVQEVNSKQILIVKKMMCADSMRLKIAKAEMNFLKNIPPCDNIIRYYGGSLEQNSEGVTVALMLLEFCKDGSLFNIIETYDEQKKKLSETQIINIVKQISNALKIMHSCNPPIAHQDIKIENVLLNDKKCKLCDFGSCSTTTYDFSKINQNDFDKHDELFEKTTTLMYRPPEMCDLYKGYYVNTKVDIWMLGCVVYVLCFFKHPFCESSKFAIIDANYQFPQEQKYSEKMLDFIRIMLTPNPKLRPSIDEVIQIANNFTNIPQIQLNSEAKQIKRKQQEQINFESEIDQQQSKHFDGDIPLEELQKAQQKILKGKTNTQKKPQQNDMQFNNFQNVPKQQEKKPSLQQNFQKQQNFDFEFGKIPQKPQQQKQELPRQQNQNVDWFGSFQPQPQSQQQFQGFNNVPAQQFSQPQQNSQNFDPFSFNSFTNQQFSNNQVQKQVNFDSFGAQPFQQQQQQKTQNNNFQNAFENQKQQTNQQQQNKANQQQQKQTQQQKIEEDLLGLSSPDKNKDLINDLNQINFSLI